MKRQFFNIAACLSMLLWLIACILWIRGFWVSDNAVIGHSRERGDEIISHDLYLFSDCCQFSVTYRVQHDHFTPEQLAMFRSRSNHITLSHEANSSREFSLLPGDGDLPWNRIGFEYSDSNDVIQTYSNYFDRRWFVPTWFLVVLFAVLPALQIILIARRRKLQRRQQLGLCLKCGFDLRATPERCPECGAVPSNAPSKAEA